MGSSSSSRSHFLELDKWETNQALASAVLWHIRMTRTFFKFKLQSFTKSEFPGETAQEPALTACISLRSLMLLVPGGALGTQYIGDIVEALSDH